MVRDICFQGQGLLWTLSGMSLIQVLVRITEGRDPNLQILNHLPLFVDLKTEVEVDLDLAVKFHVKILINN